MRAAVIVLVLASAGVAAAETALTEPADCTFIVRGASMIAGPCLTGPAEKNGSFAITSPDGAVLARVDVTARGVGKAYWNGPDFGETADVDLGTVVQIGACWASDKTKICVTR